MCSSDLNTLVLCTRIDPQPQGTGQNFIDLLAQTRKTCLEAYAHQDIPFEILVEHLKPNRSLSHHPLFQVMFVLQNNETPKLELPGLDITPLAVEFPISKFDLTLNMAEQDGQFSCVWEYATDLFKPDNIVRMAKHFEVMLNAIVADPKQSVLTLPLMTKKESLQLQAWNDTAMD